MRLEKDRKRKRGLFTSSTFLRYRQTPNPLIRVKAHAVGVSIRAFTLVGSFKFGDFQEQDSSGRFSSYMSSSYLSQPIGITVLLGFNIISILRLQYPEKFFQFQNKYLWKVNFL